MAALLISTTMFLGLGVTLATAPLNFKKKYEHEKDTVSIEQATSALRYTKKMTNGSEQRWKHSISRSLKNMFRIKSSISDLKESDKVKAEELEKDLNSQVLDMLRRSRTELKYSKASGNANKDEIFDTALKNVVTELMSDNTDDSNFEKSVMKLQTAADNSLRNSQIETKNLNEVKATRAAVNEIKPIPIVSEAETTETTDPPVTTPAAPATTYPAPPPPATTPPETTPTTPSRDPSIGLVALQQNIRMLRKQVSNQTSKISRVNQSLAQAKVVQPSPTAFTEEQAQSAIAQAKERENAAKAEAMEAQAAAVEAAKAEAMEAAKAEAMEAQAVAVQAAVEGAQAEAAAAKQAAVQAAVEGAQAEAAAAAEKVRVELEGAQKLIKIKDQEAQARILQNQMILAETEAAAEKEMRNAQRFIRNQKEIIAKQQRDLALFENKRPEPQKVANLRSKLHKAEELLKEQKTITHNLESRLDKQRRSHQSSPRGRSQSPHSA